MFDEILNKAGLNRESLNTQERETLERWAQQLSVKQVGVNDVREHIDHMISSLERELAGYETPVSFTALLFRGKRMTHVRARLYNYIMLRDFLIAPEKARAFVEKHITNLKS